MVIMGYESARALAWELCEHSDKISTVLGAEAAGRLGGNTSGI